MSKALIILLLSGTLVIFGVLALAASEIARIPILRRSNVYRHKIIAVCLLAIMRAIGASVLVVLLFGHQVSAYQIWVIRIIAYALDLWVGIELWLAFRGLRKLLTKRD